MNEILDAIREKLLSEVKEGREDFMKKIAPGIKGIYGVPNPVVNQLATEYKKHEHALVEALWDSGMYEERLLAVKILAKCAKKNSDLTWKIFRNFTTEITEWSICDTLAMGVSKALIKTDQKKIFDLSEKYLHSTNPWERRMSLVLLQCFCKQPAFHPEIKKRVTTLASDKEYYVKKAVQWLNRALEKHSQNTSIYFH